MKFKLWILLIAASLAACGGSSSKSSSPAPTTQITGAVEAPAGTVAQYQSLSPVQYALNFFISPAVAAITGLEPVKGATVELIRVDNDGNQVGAVLAATVTSITGDYTLSLPPGVNLAGNLVLRVSGTGGAEMRAQVVEREVKINPVSEFVLRSFIDNGADLNNLTTAAVVKIKGQLDDFDLTRVAGSNLNEMLNNLKAETAGFIDSAIAAETAQPATSADLNNIAGSYRNVAFDWTFDSYRDTRQDLQSSEKAVELNGWISDISFSAGSAGNLSLNLTGEDGYYSRLGNWNTDFPYVYSASETLGAGDEETFTGRYTSSGLISIDIEFDEEIDSEWGYGYREPPRVFTLQQAKGTNIFVAPASDIDVRYALTENDALDPNQRLGEQIGRGLEIFIKKPTNATAGNLSGRFGRVYLSTQIQKSGGFIEVEGEHNILTFTNGQIDSSATTLDMVNKNAYNTEAVTEALDIPFVLNTDGSFATIGGTATDAFINEAANLLIVNDNELGNSDAEQEGQNASNFYLDARQAITLAVKLPTSQPALNGRSYRMIGTQLSVTSANLQLSQLRFNTLLKMTSPTVAQVTGDIGHLTMPAGDSNFSITPTSDTINAESVQVDLGSGDDSGSISLDLPVGTTGTLQLRGYMQDGGHIGVLRSRFVPVNATNPVGLGLVMLVELP